MQLINLRSDVLAMYRRFGIGSALLTLSVSLLVITGWYIESSTLVQVHPTFAPMQYNTALGFLFSSLGLLFLLYKKAPGVFLCGTLVTLIGGATLAEYVFTLDLHIDQLFVDPFVATKTSHSGRPSPLTSFCFTLTGTALMLTAFYRKKRPLLSLVTVLGITVATLGLAGVVAYLTHIEASYSFGKELTRMAIHTSLGFLVLGASIAVTTLEFLGSQEKTFALMGAAFICITAFYLDLLLPLGIAAGIFYVLLMFCNIWMGYRYGEFILASLATLFIIFGYVIVPITEIPKWTIEVNRILSVAVIWMVAILLRINFREMSRFRTAAEQLRAILNNTVDGMMTIDSRGNIESFNKACERIFGYKAKQVLGKNVKMLMPEPYHSEHDTYLSNYNNTGKKKIIGIGRVVQGKRKDGSTFPLDLSVSEVRVSNKKIFSGIVRDITERKALMDHLEKMVKELSESNTELERFAYVASHDLQEPLRMVRNFTKLLENKYRNALDDQAAEYIRFSSEAAERMQELVQDLLEYARLGKEAEQYEDVDCQKALDYVRTNLQESIEKNHAKITCGDLPVVRVNPVRFSRLLQNLIGNAIKYCAAGVPPEIHIGVKESDTEWEFMLKDNGIGMKQEYCEKIFEPFERLHNNDEYTGTGMGLSICKKIVESFGGKIRAESEPEKGSTFYFTIPKPNQKQKRSAA